MDQRFLEPLKIFAYVQCDAGRELLTWDFPDKLFSDRPRSRLGRWYPDVVSRSMNSPWLGRPNPFLMPRNAAKRTWKRTVPAFVCETRHFAIRHGVIPARAAGFLFSTGRSVAESSGTACGELPLPLRFRRQLTIAIQKAGKSSDSGNIHDSSVFANRCKHSHTVADCGGNWLRKG